MTTAAEIIKRSYYMAQVLDPREEIEGDQASEGLHELNRILDVWGSLSQYIPSYSILTIALTAGVYTYNVTPVITQLSEAHIVDSNNVQYPLIQIDLQRFNTLNFSLAQQAPSRPQNIFIQNDFTNFPTLSKAVFYTVPDTTYTATLYAMMRLANVTYSEDLTFVPQFWIAGLEFELARQLINIYKTTPAITFNQDYEEAMRNLKAANRRDRSVQIQNEFRNYRRFKPRSVYVG